MFGVELHNVFGYNPETGAIYRKVRMGNYSAGTTCTSKCQNGYGKVTYKGQQMLAHRLAWFLHFKEQPPKQIDHINLDRADNRIHKLRGATVSQNQMNIQTHSRSKTGVKGIMPVRGGALYRAEVCVDGKRYQKHSKCIEKLKGWVQSKRLELHGEYANT